jgi:hypothetical protein
VEWEWQTGRGECERVCSGQTAVGPVLAHKNVLSKSEESCKNIILGTDDSGKHELDEQGVWLNVSYRNIYYLRTSPSSWRSNKHDYCTYLESSSINNTTPRFTSSNNSPGMIHKNEVRDSDDCNNGLH